MTKKSQNEVCRTPAYFKDGASTVQSERQQLATFLLTKKNTRLKIHLVPKARSEHGVEALWTAQKNILLSCPQCLDSMLAPGFWNKVYFQQTKQSKIGKNDLRVLNPQFFANFNCYLEVWVLDNVSSGLGCFNYQSKTLVKLQDLNNNTEILQTKLSVSLWKESLGEKNL